MGNSRASGLAQNNLKGYGQLPKRHLLRHASTLEDHEDFVCIQQMFLLSYAYLLLLLAVYNYLVILSCLLILCTFLITLKICCWKLEV